MPTIPLPGAGVGDLTGGSWNGYDLVDNIIEAEEIINAGGVPLIVPQNWESLSEADMGRLQQEQWEQPGARIFGRNSRTNEPLLIQRDDVGRIQPEAIGMNQEHEASGGASTRMRPFGPQTSLTPVSAAAAKPTAKPAAPAGDLIPLREYLQRQRATVETPSGERVPVDQMVQQGARALIPRLRGPVELPKGPQVVPKTLTDIQPVATQHQQKLAESGPDFAGEPATVARPYEVETPRETTTRTEVDRILDLLDEMEQSAGA